MPHIHTAPGQVDFTADVFVVHVASKRVLLRFHEKLKMWLVPGGHIELDETPPQAAVREALEETGLTITLYTGSKPFEHKTERYEEVIPPEWMNVHFITPEHRHVSLVYIATTETMEVREPDNHEKSGGILWLNKAELMAHPDIDETIKSYGVKALELLGC